MRERRTNLIRLILTGDGHGEGDALDLSFVSEGSSTELILIPLIGLLLIVVPVPVVGIVVGTPPDADGTNCDNCD